MVSDSSWTRTKLIIGLEEMAYIVKGKMNKTNDMK